MTATCIHDPISVLSQTIMVFFPEDVFDIILDFLKPKPIPKLCVDTVDQLRSICRSRGLRVGGNKLALINRLLDAGFPAKRPFWDTPVHSRQWDLNRVCPRTMLTFREVIHTREAWTKFCKQVDDELASACPGIVYSISRGKCCGPLPEGWEKIPASAATSWVTNYRNVNTRTTQPDRPTITSGELRPRSYEALDRCLDRNFMLCMEVRDKYMKYRKRMGKIAASIKGNSFNTPFYRCCGIEPNSLIETGIIGTAVLRTYKCLAFALNCYNHVHFEGRKIVRER